MVIKFFSSDPGCHKFLTPIIDHLALAGHDCQVLTNWGIFPEADILWFDFTDNNLIVASREDKEFLKSKKVIARLHAVEYYMGFHRQIDWSCVGDLIFVSEHMKRLCNAEGKLEEGELPVRQHVIHNGIDMDKMEFKERKNGLTLGYAGNIVPDKGILTMFHYFRELCRHGNYKLKMVGSKRLGGRVEEYYNHYIEDLTVEVADEVSDINAWMDGIDYLWQPTYAESFSYIIGEAMAKGIKPLINDFYGSEELWPKELIYKDFTDFMNIIDSPYESAKYRQYVEERYSLKEQLRKIDACLF